MKKAEENPRHPRLTPRRAAGTASGASHSCPGSGAHGRARLQDAGVAVRRVLAAHWVLAPASTTAICGGQVLRPTWASVSVVTPQQMVPGAGTKGWDGRPWPGVSADTSLDGAGPRPWRKQLGAAGPGSAPHLTLPAAQQHLCGPEPSASKGDMAQEPPRRQACHGFAYEDPTGSGPGHCRPQFGPDFQLETGSGIPGLQPLSSGPVRGRDPWDRPPGRPRVGRRRLWSPPAVCPSAPKEPAGRPRPSPSGPRPGTAARRAWLPSPAPRPRKVSSHGPTPTRPLPIPFVRPGQCLHRRAGGWASGTASTVRVPGGSGAAVLGARGPRRARSGHTSARAGTWQASGTQVGGCEAVGQEQPRLRV